MELSRLDYAILKLLYSRDCRSFFKSMTLREITDQTKTARASTARLMYRLIDWGYVTKGCRSVNANTYYLTEKALKLIEGGNPDDKE